jgi:thiamine biosynthesis lipoprotein
MSCHWRSDGSGARVSRTLRWALQLTAASVAAASWQAAASASRPQPLYRHEATRLSMACVYAIEAYGPDAQRLPRVIAEAFDEVDRIDRLMSHYRADSAVSRINREAGRQPVALEPELFDFIQTALQYTSESGGAFDITVGPLMKAWGFFRGEGHMPLDEDLRAARGHVGAHHVTLNQAARTIAFDEPGVEIDLGGIAKGYAVDRVATLLREQRVVAALISAGGSSVYGLGAPPGREAWEVAIEDPVTRGKTARTVRLKDRALSLAGRAEKSFEAGGKTYAHIMDPRSGWPVQGVLSVAVLAPSATAGDALDNAFFVLGPEGSRAYLERLADVEVVFFLPQANREWTTVRLGGGTW